MPRARPMILPACRGGETEDGIVRVRHSMTRSALASETGMVSYFLSPLLLSKLISYIETNRNWQTDSNTPVLLQYIGTVVFAKFSRVSIVLHLSVKICYICTMLSSICACATGN